MKKLAFLLIALITVLTVNAQQKGYVCTGDHVNIRTGASWMRNLGTSASCQKATLC